MEVEEEEADFVVIEYAPVWYANNKNTLIFSVKVAKNTKSYTNFSRKNVSSQSCLVL